MAAITASLSSYLFRPHLSLTISPLISRSSRAAALRHAPPLFRRSARPSLSLHSLSNSLQLQVGKIDEGFGFDPEPEARDVKLRERDTVKLLEDVETENSEFDDEFEPEPAAEGEDVKLRNTVKLIGEVVETENGKIDDEFEWEAEVEAEAYDVKLIDVFETEKGGFDDEFVPEDEVEDEDEEGFEAGVEEEKVVVKLPRRASVKLPSLSVKEKKEIASYAHSLGKKLKAQSVGKSGVTEALAIAMVESLEKNELLKDPW